MSVTVIVVEDEPLVRELYLRTLAAAGIDAAGAADAGACIAQMKVRHTDVAMIDLGLPGIDGLSLARDLRARHPDLGLMIVSRRGAPEERVEALDLGCDDYLVKPVHLGELCARVQAVARRRRPRRRVRLAGVIVDLEGRTVMAAGDEIRLTQGEFTIIARLIEAQGRVVERDVLAEAVSRNESQAEPRTVDALIRRIRRKLDPVAPGTIATVQGIGYRLGLPMLID